MSNAELVEAVSRASNSFLIPFWSLMLATPIFCTASIIYRLVKAGGMRSYAKIIEILVESAALYCFATLFALISYLVLGPAFEYAFAFWKACTGIAPTLIVACISKSRPRDTEIDQEGQNSSGNISRPKIRVYTETRTYVDQDFSREYGKAVAGHVFEIK
ncbi:hypothetical protein H2248_009961 [Termitomyces sp. 'cryptogamus']|nr:hypothetical protein H2248_009961 [Termitomyces sp. 'cryptogamus']